MKSYLQKRHFFLTIFCALIGFYSSAQSTTSCSAISNIWLVNVTQPMDSCPGNLLQNPGFEGVGSWNELNATSSDAYSGLAAAELCGPGLNRIYQFLPATANSNYNLSFWAKNTDLGEYGVSVKFFSSAWALLSDDYQNIAVTSDYQQFNITSTAPTGTNYIEVALAMHSGNGCLLLDDVCLTEESLGSTLSLTCGADIIETAAIGQTEAIVSFDPPIASTTCSNPDITITQIAGLQSGAAFPIGTSEVAFEAQDACGNVETCSFSVTVLENNVFTCSDNQIQNGGFDVLSSWSVESNGSQAAYTGIDVGEMCGPDYSRIFQFASAMEDMQYTLDFRAKESDLGENGATIKFFDAVWTPLLDAYQSVVVTNDWEAYSISAIAPPTTAYVEVSFIRNNGIGCLEVDEVCLQKSTIQSSVLSISCPPNQTIDATIGQTSAIANFANPTATTTCSAPIISMNLVSGLSSGSNFPIGLNIVSFEASDSCGNLETCSFPITVNETVPTDSLLIQCPANQTLTAPFGQNSVIANYADATASTSCTMGSLLLNRIAGLASGSAFPVGQNVVEFQASDGCGTLETCSFTITVESSSGDPLVLDCPNNRTITAAFGQSSIVVNYPIPTAVSACGSGANTVTQTSGLLSGSAFPIGINLIEYEATDSCGNNKTCSFTITINPPIIGSAVCDSILFSDSGSSLTISNLPNIIVTIQVLDATNNNLVYQCFNNCNLPTVVIPNLAAGDYSCNVKLYEPTSGGWKFLCQRNQLVTISSSTLTGAGDLQFTAVADGLQARLSWTATPMSPKDAFFVERSANGTDFAKLNAWARETTEQEMIVFNEFDSAPLSGSNFYRVRQMSQTGEERLSEVRKVAFYDLTQVQIFPNPSSNIVYIGLQDTGKKTQLILSDKLGRIVFQENVIVDNELIQLDVSEYTDGVYNLTIEVEGKRRIVKSIAVIR